MLRAPSNPVSSFEKDPWLAVNLSMFFPGIGQLYAGKLLKGITLSLSQILLIGLTAWSFFNANGNTTIGLIGFSIALSLYVLNIFDAHYCVYHHRSDPNLERIPYQVKNPWFAVCISRVFPGLGQFYGQKYLSGILFMGSTVAFLRLDHFYSSLLLFIPIVAAISTYHAYISVPRHRHRFPRFLIAGMVGTIFTWGLVINYFPNWLFQNVELFNIPSESMVPTLQVGDRILVRKSPDYIPENGDIVVFHPSENIEVLAGDRQAPQDNYYVKRLIAKPGQTVFIDRGTVYLNDRPLDETYVSELPTYQLGPSTVPDNMYFMLGDNRNQSFDSHVWGYLPKENIFGQAYKIYWPPNRVRSLVD